MSRPPLAVWLYGICLGTLAEVDDQHITLTWSAGAYERWGGNSRVMSNLLPISTPGSGPHSRRVKVFLDGLLPEGNARLNYAIDAGLESLDTYGLVTRYGRDTAGALVFQPPELPDPIRAGHYEPLTLAEVGQRLLDPDRHSQTDPAARGTESISLAGMQPKIGVHRDGDEWLAGKEGAASTWIIKLAHPAGSSAEDVVDTEVLATDLARRVGLTTITAEICDFDGVRAIAVQRYDRRIAEHGIERIHQEDAAQALGIDTSDANRKFQRGNQTPSLHAAADVLRNGGTEPDQLLALVTFNHLIGNTDFHAKNISVVRHADGTASLAPAYDSAMHLHHAGDQRLSALDVNGKYRMDDIATEDLIAEGRRWGLARRRARRIVVDTAQSLDAAFDDVDRDRYRRVSDAAIDTARGRVRAALRELEAGLGGGPEIELTAGRRRGPRR